MVKAKRSKAPANPLEPKPTKVVGKRKRTEVQTKECVICFENIPLYRNFPAFSSCSHGPETCSSCVAKQTVTLLLSFRGKGWSVCRCPQCDIPVPEEELQCALPRALVKEMKEMVDKALDSADQGWRWCLAAGCGHGGLHPGEHEMIRCRRCNYKMCFKHQVPWHTGYTCQEYETSHPQAAITKTSEELIRKVSKPCPGCGIAVQKDGGCNQMSCNKCGNMWRWNDVSHSTNQNPDPPGSRSTAPHQNRAIGSINGHTRFRPVGQSGTNSSPQLQPATNPHPDHRLMRAERQHEQLRQGVPEDVQHPHAQRQSEIPPAQAQLPSAPTNQATASIPGVIGIQNPWNSMIFQPAPETRFWTVDGGFSSSGFRRGRMQAALDSTSTTHGSNASEI